MTMNAQSPKQEALIGRLFVERDITVLGAADALTLSMIQDENSVSSRDASRLIDALLSAPYRQARPQAAPGYYIQGDDVLVVVTNREGTRTYAKRLQIEQAPERKKASWVYAPGVGSTLAGFVPLTVEEAARLGHKHGFCVVCAKALTTPASVDAGIGPVCRKRLGIAA